MLKICLFLMNYYVDSCIWRDYFENRSDGLKPLGEFAFLFFKKCSKNKDCIFFTEVIINELLKYGFDLFKFSKEFNFVFKEIKINKRDVFESKVISKNKNIPFADALHYIISKKNYLTLVTRDKHLLNLDYNLIFSPEELI